MSLFKKKINFPQFLADVITFQCDFVEENFSRLAALADEFKVLTEEDKNEFHDKAYELVVVDIMISCCQQFHKHLSSEEVGEAVSIVYAKYLTEYKGMRRTLAEHKLEKVMQFFDLICKEEDYQSRNKQNKEMGYNAPQIQGDVNEQKFYVCRAFANYCVGEDMKSANWEGRHFAAFKFAKGFVKSGIVGNMLKEFRIIF